MYEIAQWRYPKPKDGEAQAQDPADRTADGADMVAALRYAVMSQYRAAEFEIPTSDRRKNRDAGLEKLNDQIKSEDDYGA